MFALQTPAWLVSCAAWVTPGAAQPVQFLILTISLVLFGLKLADVPWLRLPRQRRAYLLVTCIVVLLHCDVVRRMCGAESDPRFAAYPAVVSCVLATGCPELWRRARAALAGARVRALRRQVRVWLAQLIDRAASLDLPRRRRLAVCPCPPNRAPPR